LPQILFEGVRSVQSQVFMRQLCVTFYETGREFGVV
jgi:hypothetical protein